MVQGRGPELGGVSPAIPRSRGGEARFSSAESLTDCRGLWLSASASSPSPGSGTPASERRKAIRDGGAVDPGLASGMDGTVQGRGPGRPGVSWAEEELSL